MMQEEMMGNEERSPGGASSMMHSGSAPGGLQSVGSERSPGGSGGGLQRAGSSVIGGQANGKSGKSIEEIKAMIRNKVKGTVQERSGPSFESRIAAASAKKGKEANATRKKMEDQIAQSVEKGRARQGSSIFRGKEEEPEPPEVRTERGRKRLAQEHKQYWKEHAERVERMANREPLYRLEEVAAGVQMLKEKQAAHKRQLTRDEMERWEELKAMQEKVADRPMVMENIETHLTVQDLRRMASPVKDFGIDVKVKKAIKDPKHTESAWMKTVAEINERANNRVQLHEIEYKRGGVTPGNHVECRDTVFSCDFKEEKDNRRFRVFSVGIVKELYTDGNGAPGCTVDFDGKGKPVKISPAYMKKLRYIPPPEPVRPRELGPLEKLIADAITSPLFKNSEWAKTTGAMRERMDNREKLHEISYPPKAWKLEKEPVHVPSAFILKIQADMAEKAEIKGAMMREQDKAQWKVLREVKAKGLLKRDRTDIGLPAL